MVLNSVSGYGKNSIGFGDFNMKNLEKNLEKAQRINGGVTGVAIKPNEGDNKGIINFVVTDIAFNPDKKESSQQRVEGYWLPLFKKIIPGNKESMILKIDSKETCIGHDIAGFMELS